jgi:DNA-binding response OmpR family regulator
MARDCALIHESWLLFLRFCNKNRRTKKTNQSACIMAVDDEPTTLRVLRRILEPEGYEVILASDGSSALALLDEHKPDLVILDIMMPGLNGFQVLDSIRQGLNIPVIMLTARYELESLEKALQMGADDYVRKPFSPAVLLARIKVKLRRVEQAGQPCERVPLLYHAE